MGLDSPSPDPADTDTETFARHQAAAAAEQRAFEREVAERAQVDWTTRNMCPRCQKRFTRASDLIIHGHAHTGLKRTPALLPRHA
jgi:hypothetical protein